MDMLGDGLDGMDNGGHADFVTTFTTHYQANQTPVLGIPDFPRAAPETPSSRCPTTRPMGSRLPCITRPV